MSNPALAGPQMSNFPNGFSNGLMVRGMPVLSAYTGQVFWVDSNNGADGNPGTFNRPLATIDRAFSLVVAGRGDLVLVKPGHAETISNATTLLADVAGVAVVGLGIGAMRPTLTFGSATTASIPVSAANVLFQNFLLVANYAAVVAPFTVGAAKDFALNGCEFRDTSSILNFKFMVDVGATSNAADGLSITDSRFLGLGTTSGTACVNMAGTNDRFYFKRNKVRTKATSDAALMPIATGKVVTSAEIDWNDFDLQGASGATTGILITTNGSTNSGLISYNTIQSLDATSEILVTASSGFRFHQNYYSGAADKSGYLLPAADA